MKNHRRSRKCGSCVEFLKFKNQYAICDLFDWRVKSGTRGCKEWKGTEIPTRMKGDDNYEE